MPQIEITPEWCIEAAKREDGGEIGAGPLARDPEPEWRPCQTCNCHGSWAEPDPMPDDPHRCRIVECNQCGGTGWTC